MKYFLLLFIYIISVSAAYAADDSEPIDCDKEFPKVMTDFRTLYDSAKYEGAYYKLMEFVNYCDFMKDKRTYMIWSRASSAAFKMKEMQMCLDAVHNAEDFTKKNPNAKPDAGELKNVEQNKNFCAKALKEKNKSGH